MSFNRTSWRGSVRPAQVVLERDESNAAAYQLVEKSIAEAIPLVFLGAVGCGKTTLMAEIDRLTSEVTTVADLLPKTKRVFGRVNAWTTADEYVRDTRRWMDFTSDEKRGQFSPTDLATSVLRLFVDDLGVESHKALMGETDPKAIETMVKLLHARHQHGLPTWITTNLSRDEIVDRYGERVMSRLVESSLFVTLAGGDRRVPMLRKVRDRDWVS